MWRAADPAGMANMAEPTPGLIAEGDINLTGDKVATYAPEFLDHTGSVRRATPDGWLNVG